jgi:hypothetical protein
MTTSNSPSTIPVQDAGKVERDFHYKYTVQKGYFLQSEDSTDDQNFDFVRQCLLDPTTLLCSSNSSPSWESIAHRD